MFSRINSYIIILGFVLVCSIQTVVAQDNTALKSQLQEPVAKPSSKLLALVDQRGKTDSPQAYPGEIVLVLTTNANRIRRIKKWSRGIDKISKDLKVNLHLLYVTHIPENKDVDKIIPYLQKKVPEDVSILIDEHNYWLESFKLAPKKMNLLIFSKDGLLYKTYSEKYSIKLLNMIHKDIKALSIHP